MSTQTESEEDPDPQQVLSHVVDKFLKREGGSISVEHVTLKIGDLINITSNEARDLIDEGENQGIYQVERGNGGNLIIRGVNPVGPIPDIVAEAYGEVTDDTNSFTRLSEVNDVIAAALERRGYTSYRDIVDTDPDQLYGDIEAGLDVVVPEGDFTQITIITESQEEALKTAGYTTFRDLAQADTENLADAVPTLQPADAEKASEIADDHAEQVTPEQVDQIIEAATQNIPIGKRIARERAPVYERQVKERGGEKAIVEDITEVTKPIGRPKWVDEDVPPDHEEACYISNVGHNATDSVETPLWVRSDSDHPLVPKKETHPEAGPGALPINENGDVVTPAIPKEPFLQLPMDELLAKKLGRGTGPENPIKIEGPHGAGKNFIIKWLAHVTNNGYLSIDVSETTLPEDLFGPLSPNEDGVIVPRDGVVKQGLKTGAWIVLNEFPIIKSGASTDLHRMLNEGELLIKEHGQLIKPHPASRIIITMNPPDEQRYRNSEPMSANTRDRFVGFHHPYMSDVEMETEALLPQVNGKHQHIEKETLQRVVRFAQKTREEEGWPTLSTRAVRNQICQNIIDGASPRAAVKNALWNVSGVRESHNAQGIEEALGNTL